MAGNQKKHEKSGSGQDFPIVGIGASAGGLDAFITLLEYLPVDTGMAFVFISHLSPTYKSMLARLFSRHTKIPVSEARHNEPVEPDHLYVIPPSEDLSIERGILRLLPKERGVGPIDRFLKALAEDKGKKAIGVVLSGALSDGTLGLRAVKAAGGRTLVQSEKTAKYKGMPRSAIRAAVADHILSPEDIARELAAQSYNALRERREEVRISEADMSRVLNFLRSNTGIDFAYYRASTIKRRILRRIALNRMDMRSYLRYLEHNSAEVETLFRDILINVTNFFRDADVFEVFRKKILPRILKNRAREEPIRIWIPGCSTGKEVYSLTILIFEFLGARAEGTPIQIFATDVNEKAIEAARSGVYARDIEADVSKNRLKRFFTQIEDGYRVKDFVRDACVFALHDVANDPPLPDVDFISCRNLLIYFSPTLQDKALRNLHYALRPGGFLLLGKSEFADIAGLFDPFDKKHKIFRKKAGSTARKKQSAKFRLKQFAPPAAQGIPAAELMGGFTFPFKKTKGGDRRITQLNEELSGIRDYLRTVLKEKNAANDELKVANEEVLSSNETLQQTNEELESTKEELQSTNEELITINEELESRNRELGVLNADLSNLLGSVHIPIVMLTRDLRVRRFTSLAEKLLNVGRSHVGKPLNALKPNIKMSVLELEKIVLEVIDEGRILNRELQDRDGRWYSLWARPYKSALNRIDGAVLIFIDIHDLKKVREALDQEKAKYDTYLQNIGEGVAAIDQNRRIIFANKKFAFMFGEKLEDLIGQPYFDVCVVLDEKGKIVPVEERPVDLALRGKIIDTYPARVYFALRKDKSRFPIAVMASPIMIGEKIEGAVAVVQDITKEWQVDKSKSEFLSLAAHQLRTPPSAIRWFAEMLLAGDGGPITDTQREYLEEIFRANRRMITLVNELLNVSRIELGTFTLEPEAVDFGGIVKNAVSEHKPQMREKRISLEERYAKSLPLLKVDPRFILIALENILSNAVKYTPAGGKIRVAVTRSGNKFLVSVSDTGLGIPEGEKPKIFSKLYRASNVRERDTEGTGLGLYIAKAIVEQSGGKIWFESQEGRGTTFFISFPLAQNGPKRPRIRLQ